MDAKKNKIILRKKENTVGTDTLKPKEIDIPGLTGTLPFSSGRTIHKSRENLPEEVLAEEQRVNTAPFTVPETELKKAIQPPKPVNIDDLPPEKLAALKGVIKGKAPTTSARPIIPRGPGILEAISIAEKADARLSKEMNKPKQPEPTPVLKIKEKPVEVPPTPTPMVEPQHENISPPETACIHCGWPIGKADLTDPSTTDKHMFVAAVLSQNRFTKEFELFGGQLHVIFRTLTTREVDEVVKQLVHDWNSGKISGPAQSVAEATKYQLVLSLEGVETNVGMIRLPTFDEYSADVPENETVIPLIVEHVMDETLKMEPLRRAISKAYGHFLDTVSKLEVMAETSSFWTATVG